MGSYVPATAAERREMLQAIGMSSEKELYSDVPASMLLDRPLDIPAGMSELEVRAKMEAMAAKNRVYDVVLRGAGAYDHYIPSIVKYIPAK
jgi:glycine dehydrogenase subunit 1